MWGSLQKLTPRHPAIFFLSFSLGYQYAGLLIALLAVVMSFMAPLCESLVFVSKEIRALC